jgi:two-component system, chemotaxis family, sensor kinase CheA
MSSDMTPFREQFKVECREHIQEINELLLQLEKSPAEHDIINALMRLLHTIKGSATMMEFPIVADLAHSMENVLEQVRDTSCSIKREHFIIFFKIIDMIEVLLDEVLPEDLDAVLAEINLCFSDTPSSPGDSDVTAPKSQLSAAPKEIKMPSVTAVTEDCIRINTSRLDQLINLSGELIVSKITLETAIKQLFKETGTDPMKYQSISDIMEWLKSIDNSMSSLVSNVKNEIMDLRMTPLSYMFRTFHRTIRDLSSKANKDVTLEIRGEDTMLDKSIIDKMKTPLIHLIRNAVDHGIESTARRETLGKPTAGNILLEGYKEGALVIIKITDDGAGIHLGDVKARILEKNLLSEEALNLLDESQLLSYLFTPGFTTKKDVSDISGRGVGLDVVYEAITKMKGVIEISSKENVGTEFTVKLPLTLAITDNLLVTVSNDTFAIPIDTIVEAIRIKNNDITYIETKEAISVRGEILPLIRLDKLFGINVQGIIEKPFHHVIIVHSNRKKIGLLVGNIQGHHEVVNKPLEAPLEHAKNIAGGTILGNGNVILTLNIPSIIESVEDEAAHIFSQQQQKQALSKKKKSILLVEDTLSTAIFEKNILESAGFSVEHSRNGEEAWKTAARRNFDLIITDVQMPVMDGLKLTKKMKTSDKHKNTPVIIITTKESTYDKRQGMEAGADAYILKREFSSESLLDTIDRLIGT